MEPNRRRETLVIFTRYPEPGRTKTRLIPKLGARGAADVHRHMLEHVLTVAASLRDERAVEVEVRIDGAEAGRFRNEFGDTFRYVSQGDGTLGDRMGRAFYGRFRGGDDAVVIVGSDIPGLSTELVEEAFESLDGCDVVFGPAADGGYYLVGLRSPVESLFRNIEWGTSSVLERSCGIAHELGLKVDLLETLQDVDREDDLQVLRRPAGAGLSVVIPALDEEVCVGDAIQSAAADGVEVLVVDGGSRDGTREVAEAAGAKVVRGARGRAKQMNEGARAAKGSLLVFLHADSRLPAGFEGAVRKTLARDEIALGAFRLDIEGASGLLRFIERAANWRSGSLSLPYGDQALFVRRDLFESIGGFPDMPIMEDYAFVRRARKEGRIVTLDLPVVTSPRRWRKRGVWRTTLINQAVIAGYHLGIPPGRLAAWYRGRGRGVWERG